MFRLKFNVKEPRSEGKMPLLPGYFHYLEWIRCHESWRRSLPTNHWRDSNSYFFRIWSTINSAFGGQSWDTMLGIWSIISSACGSSDLGALRRYKSLMWLGHTARFAPSIASQLRRPNVELVTDHILTV